MYDRKRSYISGPITRRTSSECTVLSAFIANTRPPTWSVETPVMIVLPFSSRAIMPEVYPGFLKSQTKKPRFYSWLFGKSCGCIHTKHIPFLSGPPFQEDEDRLLRPPRCLPASIQIRSGRLQPSETVVFHHARESPVRAQSWAAIFTPASLSLDRMCLRSLAV